MKVHRLLSITMHLLRQKRVSAQELADHFEVSLRTVYRDLETINGAGIPIVSFPGVNGGYEIMEQYHIDRQIVTLEDLNAIMTALKGLQNSLGDKELNDLMAKVGALVAKSAHNRPEEAAETLLFDTNPWRVNQADKTLVNRLRQSAKERRVVRFAYTGVKGAGEERIVEPVGLAWKGFAWYLYAYCRMRKDYRTFRLSRIRELHEEPETFRRRELGLEELDARWGNNVDMHLVRIVLRVHPRVRVRAEEYFHPDEIVEEPDGYLLLKTEQAENPWLYGMLMSYGADIQVLEPQNLADTLRERASQVLRMYGE